MSWDEQVDELRSDLERAHQAREDTLRRCRLLIQKCSSCIRHVHRRQFESADVLLTEAKQIASETRDGLAELPEILFAGYVQDAEKELVEAATVLAWIGHRSPTPGRSELRVSVSSYLNGLGEAASETRRYLLDELRQGRLDESERLLGLMESTYDDLVTFDYPDALTGGLRRTCDALRAVIERTRSDVTMTQVQNTLIEELKRAR